MFFKFFQSIKMSILISFSVHNFLHAMQELPEVDFLYGGAEYDYIWVSDSLDGKALKVLAKDFAQKHGFTWTEGLLYECKDNFSELLCEQDTYVEMTNNSRNCFFSQIALNKDKLVLRYMGESVGWGLFARENITPDSKLGYTYIAFYGGLLKAYSPMNPRNEHGSRSSVEILKGQKGYASINAEKYRNLGSFFQHAPRTLENFIFDSGLKSEIAIANLEYTPLVLRNLPYVFFRACHSIAKGTLLAWDYGQDYWDGLNEVGHLFSIKGELIERSCYKLKEVTVNVILDENILKLLSPLLKYSLKCKVLLSDLNYVKDFFFLPLAESLEGKNDVMVGVFAKDILEEYQKCPHSPNLNIPGTLSKKIETWDKEYLIKVQDAIHHTIAVCQNCGEKSKKSENLLACGQCKAVFYCDRNCQKANWPIHKQSCNKNI